jgi:hypothetical protein
MILKTMKVKKSFDHKVKKDKTIELWVYHHVFDREWDIEDDNFRTLAEANKRGVEGLARDNWDAFQVVQFTLGSEPK